MLAINLFLGHPECFLYSNMKLYKKGILATLRYIYIQNTCTIRLYNIFFLKLRSWLSMGKLKWQEMLLKEGDENANLLVVTNQ